MCYLLRITVTAWEDICNIETRCYRSVFMGRHLQSQINMLSLGHLSPCTINQRQSKKLLLDIKLKLPKTLTLPDDPDKFLWYFYRQLTCTAIMENKRNVVAISVPLLDLKGQFEIYNIFNLPLIMHNNWSNQDNTLVAQYKLETNGLAVSAEKTKYVILSDNEVQKCANPSVTFCGIKSAVYPINLSKLCVIALIMKSEPNVDMQCQTIIRLNSMLPLANYLSNRVWIITTQKYLMFSVVCQEPKLKQFIVTVRASIAKVKLELSCSAFNDYLTLLPYYHTLTEYLVEDTLSDVIKNYNIFTVKICKPFHKALPEYKVLKLPKQLKSIEQIPMGNLIKQLQDLKDVSIETGIPSWGYFIIWVGLILLMVLFMFIYCKYFRKKKLCWLAKGKRNKFDSEITTRYGMVSARQSEGADYTSRAANVSLPLKDDAQRQEQRLQQAVTNVVRSLYPRLDLSRTSRSE